MYLYDKVVELTTEEVRNIILNNDVVGYEWKEGWFTLRIRSEGLHDIRGLGMTANGEWKEGWFIEPSNGSDSPFGSDSMNRSHPLQSTDVLSALDRAISFMRWSLAEERYRVNIRYGDRTVITKGFNHEVLARKFAQGLKNAEITITYRGLSILDGSNQETMETAS